MNSGFCKKICSFDGMLAGLILLMPLLAVLSPRFFAYYPLLCALLLAIPFWRAGYRFRADWGLASYLGAIFALGAVSILWSVSPETSFDRVKDLSGIFIGGWLLISLIQSSPTPPDLARFSRIFAVGVALASLIIGIDYQAGQVFMALVRGQSVAEMVGAAYNRPAVSVALFGVIALFLTCREKQYAYLIGLLISLAIMTCAVQSQSCHLALIAGIVALLVFPYRQGWAWTAVLLGLVILASATPVLVNYAASYGETFFNDYAWLREGYAMHRIQIWDMVLDHAVRQPIWGHGIEATRVTEFEKVQAFTNSHTILHPHNVVAQFWIEFGLLGIAVASACMVHWLKRAKLAAQDVAIGRLYMPLFLSIFAVSCVAYGFWQSWWIGLILMLIATIRYLSKVSVK